jgi:hypothetical protein
MSPREDAASKGRRLLARGRAALSLIAAMLVVDRIGETADRAADPHPHRRLHPTGTDAFEFEGSVGERVETEGNDWPL